MYYLATIIALISSYNDRVDYCKVTSDGSQIEPMLRTTRMEFESFSANQTWRELNNVQKQEQMKGLVRLYKVKGQSYRICAISSGDDLQWAIIIETFLRIGPKHQSRALKINGRIN